MRAFSVSPAASRAEGEARGERLAPQVEALKAVWGGIVDAGRMDFGTLHDIVSVLSRSVTDTPGASLPLVPLKSHDTYTGTHILNVGILSMGLAKAAGLPPDTVGDVGVGALLHDVGKSLVPLEILNKPGRLTDGEFAVVKRHPMDGARLLLRTPGAPEVAVAVAWEHHVRFDGHGYPEIPRGWKTNLATSITQIADSYDALRTDRPWRKGMSRGKILSIMREASGRHFEPRLLRLFFDAVVPREDATPESDEAPAG